MSTSPDGTVSMMLIILVPFFKMIRIVQGFSDQVPLQGSAVSGINRKYLVCTPAQGAMVYNKVFIVQSPESVVATIAIYHAPFLIFISHPEADITHNDIISGQYHGVVCKTDAITGGCLTGDRNI